MKVLAISASPRHHGNSDLLCDQFLKGAAESGHTVEKIRLAEKSILPCLACDACQSGKPCPRQDDTADILNTMVEADIILLSTPVYFCTMAAQMKLLIDRSFARFKEMKGKAFYFAITAATPEHADVQDTISGLRGFLRCLPDAPKEQGILYGTGAWDKGDILRHPAYEMAYEMGKTL